MKVLAHPACFRASIWASRFWLARAQPMILLMRCATTNGKATFMHFDSCLDICTVLRLWKSGSDRQRVSYAGDPRFNAMVQASVLTTCASYVGTTGQSVLLAYSHYNRPVSTNGPNSVPICSKFVPVSGSNNRRYVRWVGEGLTHCWPGRGLPWGAQPSLWKRGWLQPPSLLSIDGPELVISVIDDHFPSTISQNSYSD